MAVDIFEELDRLDKEDAPDTDLSDEKTEDMGVASRSGEEFEDVLSAGALATSSSSINVLPGATMKGHQK